MAVHIYVSRQDGVGIMFAAVHQRCKLDEVGRSCYLVNAIDLLEEEREVIRVVLLSFFDAGGTILIPFVELVHQVIYLLHLRRIQEIAHRTCYVVASLGLIQQIDVSFLAFVNLQEEVRELLYHSIVFSVRSQNLFRTLFNECLKLILQLLREIGIGSIVGT